MKYLVLVCAVWHLAQGRAANTLPEYLKELACRKADPKYEKCLLNSLEKARPYFVKGMPELNFPPIDPFELPVLAVNRTVNDLVRINAVCRNIRAIGAANFILDDIKADPVALMGWTRLTIPWIYLDMDYDVSGQLLVIPLQSKGHFQGNFTNIQMYLKGNMKTYKKDGIEYYRVNKVIAKCRVGDGHIKMTEENKDMQYAADLIADFFNENPRRVMDAVNPLFTETTKELFRVFSDQILAILPASEWIPE